MSVERFDVPVAVALPDASSVICVVRAEVPVPVAVADEAN
jgi:hypothetical protein